MDQKGHLAEEEGGPKSVFPKRAIPKRRAAKRERKVQPEPTQARGEKPKGKGEVLKTGRSIPQKSR